MLSNEIIFSESFIEMSGECQALYSFLNGEADDEGFVEPKAVIRKVSAKEESLRILMAKGFVIPLRGRVAVLRHFHINNQIRKERKTPTIFQEQKHLLQLHDGKYYLKIQDNLDFTAWSSDIPVIDYILSPNCPPDVRLGKVSIGKIEPEMHPENKKEENTENKNETKTERTDEEKARFEKQRTEMYQTLHNIPAGAENANANAMSDL